MKKLIKATDTLKELFTYYIIAILLCAAVFSWAEGKSLLDAIWWAFVTASTTGYGDIYPVTAVGRIAAVILMHGVSFFILPMILGRVLSQLIEDKDKFTNEEQETLKQKINDIQKAVTKKDDQKDGEKEIIICAACIAEDGRIFRGHRHHNAIAIIHELGMKMKPTREAQGFITSKNRYVNRREAMQIQLAAGITSAEGQYHDKNELYSEDLY